MQQPLISDKLKEDFKNIIMEQAISYGKAGIANSLKRKIYSKAVLRYPKNGFDFLVIFLVKSLSKFNKSFFYQIFLSLSK